MYDDCMLSYMLLFVFDLIAMWWYHRHQFGDCN